MTLRSPINSRSTTGPRTSLPRDALEPHPPRPRCARLLPARLGQDPQGPGLVGTQLEDIFVVTGPHQRGSDPQLHGHVLYEQLLLQADLSHSILGFGL